VTGPRFDRIRDQVVTAAATIGHRLATGAGT
jgi:hypothetical protein